MLHIDASDVKHHSIFMMRMPTMKSNIVFDDKFRAFFGCSLETTAEAWNIMVDADLLPRKGMVYHLLWTLAFLKLYNNQRVLATICGVCELTLRKWTKLFLNALSEIDIIKMENRFRDNIGCTCLVTVDGTDCRIEEIKPFNRGWYSHKFKGPGVRYEVAVCIQTGWIVWVNGPYPCGEWPDLRIVRDRLIHQLLPGEMYIADGGYSDGGQFSVTPNGLNTDEQYMQSVCRSRHETVNKRFKQFSVISGVFRHDVDLHGKCFHAVANLTQMAIQRDEPLFQVEYDDRDI